MNLDDLDEDPKLEEVKRAARIVAAAVRWSDTILGLQAMHDEHAGRGGVTPLTGFLSQLGSFVYGLRCLNGDAAFKSYAPELYYGWHGRTPPEMR
jgi:hypothetical protein